MSKLLSDFKNEEELIEYLKENLITGSPKQVTNLSFKNNFKQEWFTNDFINNCIDEIKKLEKETSSLQKLGLYLLLSSAGVNFTDVSGIK